MKKDARKTCACDWGSRANPPAPDLYFADFTSALFNPLRGSIYFMPYSKNHGDFGEFGDDVLKNKLPRAFGIKNIWCMHRNVGNLGSLGDILLWGSWGGSLFVPRFPTSCGEVDELTAVRSLPNFPIFPTKGGGWAVIEFRLFRFGKADCYVFPKSPKSPAFYW